MFDYFRGWKRKAGLVTLVMACAFAAGWVRSAFKSDTFCVPCGFNYYIQVTSSRRHLILATMTAADREGKSPRLVPFWMPQSYDPDSWIVFQNVLENGAETSVFGSNEVFSVVRHEFGFNNWVVLYRMIGFPYWSIVIPLTLLSAWLLLGKPRDKASVREPNVKAK